MTRNREFLLHELHAMGDRARAADMSDAWSEHAAQLRASVGDEDRYWLEDRIQDEECELGFAPHPSHISHLLASQGLAYLGDEQRLPGPHPYFLLLGASMIAGRSTAPPDRGNGGLGPATWGYIVATQTAWFAHAVPGATADEIQRGLTRMREELAALGIAVVEAID